MAGKLHERQPTFRLAQEQLTYYSHPGTRKGNEDCCGYWLLQNPPSALLVLADGMGGYAYGEVASQLAVQTLIQVYQDAGGFAAPEADLRETTRLAHQRITDAAAEDSDKRGMGTT